MSKRPRTEPPCSDQEDIWGDDFTYDEVNTIENIETLASQSHFAAPPVSTVCLNNHSARRDDLTTEGEIKNLKIKIKQLEIQLSNMKQKKDDMHKTMRKMIDCKDTELKFQKQESTALKNKIKEINLNVSKVVPQKNVSFSCMKTGRNSMLLHSASEHNLKKHVSTQTVQTIAINDNPLVKESFPEKKTNYEKLKKCLYPDLFGSPNNNDVKNLSTIQECYLILAKLMALENYDENQSCSLIELLLENCIHILESTVISLQNSIDDTDFVKREKQLIYSYLNLNKQCCSMFDLQFSHLLDCISVLTTITDFVPKIVMSNRNNIFQTFVHFLQTIGLQSRTLEYISVIKAILKFLTCLCSCNWNVSKHKQLEIFNVIKEVVFCRPCIDILQELICLLSTISNYTEIIDSLCRLSSPKTFILSDKVCTFTTGTCVLRVFCLQVELLKHSNYLITNYLYFVITLLNGVHIPKWMNKIPNRTCECTSTFVDLTIHFLYIVFCLHEKDKELLDFDLLKLTEEIIENSCSILYRLGKLDEEFRSHISKCRGQYDVIVQKIQKLDVGKSNKFFAKELKKFEFKSSLSLGQCNLTETHNIFPINVPKFIQQSQYQFDEPNKQVTENTIINKKT